ncbi:hypothetical protein J3F81_006372, partial [Coemansia sp. RSA 371]
HARTGLEYTPANWTAVAGACLKKQLLDEDRCLFLSEKCWKRASRECLAHTLTRTWSDVHRGK